LGSTIQIGGDVSITTAPRILGLDVSLACLGFCVITPDSVLTYGAIKTKPANRKKNVRVGDDQCERARFIARYLDHLNEDWGGFQACFAEMPTGGARNSKAAQGMALAKAVVVTFCEVRKIPLEPIDPFRVKRELAGKSTASKEEVHAELFKRYPELEEKMTEHSSKTAEAILDAFATIEVSKESDLWRAVCGKDECKPR
jgi:Holliday junction resolvasome RuvABC endonuclease subunit